MKLLKSKHKPLFKWDIWVEDDVIRARITHNGRSVEAKGYDVPEAMNRAMNLLGENICCLNVFVSPEFRMGRYRVEALV